MKSLKSGFHFWKSWLQSEFLWNGNVRRLSDGGVTVSNAPLTVLTSSKHFKAFKDHMFHMFQEVGVFCWHPRHSSFCQSVKGMIEALWLVSVQGREILKFNLYHWIGQHSDLSFFVTKQNRRLLTWKKCQKVALNRPPELHPEQTTPFSAVASMVGESWPQHTILRSSQMEGQYNTRSPGKKNFLFLYVHVSWFQLKSQWLDDYVQYVYKCTSVFVSARLCIWIAIPLELSKISIMYL